MTTIYEQLKEALVGREGDIITATAIKGLLEKKYGVNKSSVLLSDYCYNRYNEGVLFTKHLFQYIDHNMYQYLGENALYTGLIFQKKKGQANECIVGEWINGVKYVKRDGLSKAQITQLHTHYNEIWRYELHILQSKPTELRHLMGRIGEFLCVLQTDGQLALNANERGYDVVSANGRKISVKTTAQTNGFIAINRNTFHLCDDLFIVQYKNDMFQVVFFGEKEKIIDSCRVYQNTYELDVSKIVHLKH
ncbi:hypothetical protein MHB42_13490 [Lysinibacillus sp. FSL K6-0232]|uniref:DUF7225 domain-containing protein n=1 Tax=unclassified Lysinibacillus TaxID=2636778 RepID=UPI0030F6B1D8